MAVVHPEFPDVETDAPPRKKRSWGEKFQIAFRGWKFGVRGHASFFVHFFFMALVLATAVVLHCDAIEWCLLIGCIGMVLTTELFNSAIETLFRGLPEDVRERVWPCLDIAAGAVLLAAVTASIIGLIIFLSHIPKLASLLGLS
jgi:diacylglycerol kinase